LEDVAFRSSDRGYSITLLNQRTKLNIRTNYEFPLIRVVEPWNLYTSFGKIR